MTALKQFNWSKYNYMVPLIGAILNNRVDDDGPYPTNITRWQILTQNSASLANTRKKSNHYRQVELF